MKKIKSLDSRIKNLNPSKFNYSIFVTHLSHVEFTIKASFE